LALFWFRRRIVTENTTIFVPIMKNKKIKNSFRWMNQSKLIWTLCLALLFIFKSSGADRIIEFNEFSTPISNQQHAGLHKNNTDKSTKLGEIAFEEDEFNEDDNDENNDNVHFSRNIHHEFVFSTPHSQKILVLEKSSYIQVYACYQKVPLFIIFQNRKVDLCA
jgi:hypothetical protein